MILQTDRLILRPFAPDDLEAMVAINADPRVMRYFPAPYDRAQTEQMLQVWADKQARYGYAFSAVARRDDHALLGMVGLNRLEQGAPISPCTEIGWRLTPQAWGQGYATEAARAWLKQGVEGFGLDEILSFAPQVNLASQAVMQRIGMERAETLDFDHPSIPPGHVLRPMAVYRLGARAFAAADEGRGERGDGRGGGKTRQS